MQLEWRHELAPATAQHLLWEAGYGHGIAITLIATAALEVQAIVVSKMLADRDRQIATHAWGAGGCLMQNLHCGFAAPNTAILEIPPYFGGLHTDLIDGGFRLRDGYVLPPDRPGLGIVLTDDIKARYPFQPGTGEFNSVPGKVMPRPK